jgi:hypothetical protein
MTKLEQIERAIATLSRDEQAKLEAWWARFRDEQGDREAKLRALRETLDASVARGGSHGDEEIGAALEAKAAELAKQGF